MGAPQRSTQRRDNRRPALGGSPALRPFTLQALRAEVVHREQEIERIKERRRSLEAELGKLEVELVEIDGKAGSGGQSAVRFRNPETLAEVLSRVLSGRVLSVRDAAEAVRAAGYRTVSRHFRTQVNIVLTRSGLFERVARGRYTAGPRGNADRNELSLSSAPPARPNGH